MTKEERFAATFQAEFDRLERLQGLRIWTDGEKDYMAWSTKPVLEPEFPPVPDPWQGMRQILSAFCLFMIVLTILAVMR